ncbi:MAG TPA: histidine kinase dimerization/phosphoacceptor domain -containing protein [Spirochaetota bacterium]|nr:histidine kinase dimerization/phosphoacceptor domain -containing protein [Spirochaetota bacterium]
MKDFSKSLTNEVIEHMLDYLLVVDDSKRIIRINNRLLERLDFKNSDIVDKHIFNFIENKEILEDFFIKIDKRIIKKFSCEINFIDKNNEKVLISLNGTVITNRYDDIICLVLVGNDSAYLKQMESEIISKEQTFDWLKKNISEKDILLKEIHHRVKNNLNIIISIIGLQTEYSKNDEVKNILLTTNNRIYTIAYIYEYLYKNNRVDDINFYEFAQNLTSNIYYISHANKQISTMLEIDKSIDFNVSTSIPMGLIINELFSNVLKYAFTNSNVKNEVCISLIKNDENTFQLIFKDNGVGIPHEYRDLNLIKSLGLKLVSVLVEQLQGEINVSVENGTIFNIKFSQIKR